MDDLISRQAAIDAVHRAVIDSFDFVKDDSESPITYHDEQLLSLNKAITTKIKALPSVERKKGKWKAFSAITCACSECGQILADWIVSRSNFCPNCGAEMRREQ